MKHRLFIAINIPNDLKERLEGFRNKYERKLPGRWIEKENMHLTVLFLGYIAENTITTLRQIINTINNTSFPTEISFNEIIPAPPKIQITAAYNLAVRPRMIWLSGPFSQKLQDIKIALETEIEKAHIPFQKESRLLHPHINLVRFDQVPDFPFKRIPLKYKFQAKSLDLMESHLSRGGARYKKIDLQ